MDSSMIFFGFGGLLVWGIILMLLIRSATHSDVILRHTRRQTKLLEEIARKHGVEDSTIEQIEGTSNYK